MSDRLAQAELKRLEAEESKLKVQQRELKERQILISRVLQRKNESLEELTIQYGKYRQLLIKQEETIRQNIIQKYDQILQTYYNYEMNVKQFNFASIKLPENDTQGIPPDLNIDLNKNELNINDYPTVRSSISFIQSLPSLSNTSVCMNENGEKESDNDDDKTFVTVINGIQQSEQTDNNVPKRRSERLEVQRNNKKIKNKSQSNNDVLNNEKPQKRKINIRKKPNVKIKNKKWKCSYCNYSTKRKHHLIRHIRTHTNERPFKCNLCDKSFGMKGGLTRHMRTHTNERPFKCNLCDKAFKSKGNLAQHMQSSIHTGEKPFKCNQCAKLFGMKGSLTRHMRTHTNERPFKSF